MLAARGQPTPRPVQAGLRSFGLAFPLSVVLTYGIDRAFQDSFPQGDLMLRCTHRRNHFGQKAIGIAAVDPKVRGRRLDSEMHAGPARSANHFQPLMAGQMDDIEMRASNFGEIEGGLDSERFRNCGSSILPIGQGSLRPARLEFVTRPVDQRAGLAMNTRDGIRTERGYRAKAMQQNIIGHRFNDAWYAGHVELKGANAELLGIAGDFVDLRLGEYLRMENRIDIAALVHRFTKRR